MGFQCVPIWIVVGLGQSVLDTVLIADTTKDMPAETVSGPVSVSGLLRHSKAMVLRTSPLSS